MWNLTEDDIKRMDERDKYEDSKLDEWGWVRTKEMVENPHRPGEFYGTEVRTNPKSGKKYTHGDFPYSQAICNRLEDFGWKDITEIKIHGGRHLWESIKSDFFNPKKPDKMALFQSPKTKKIYGYHEAQYILESDWDETKIWENKGISEQTRVLNDLIGDNFDKDEVQTWFYLDGDDWILALWEERDGEIVELKSIRTPNEKRTEAFVSWGLNGLQYHN